MKVQIPHERINLYLLSLLLIAFPFHVTTSNILLIVFGGHWLFWLIQQPRTFRFSDRRIWLLLLPYILCAASLLYTTNVKEGVFVLDKKIGLFIFPFCLGTMPKMSRRHVHRLMVVATGSVLAALVVCYVVATKKLINHIPGGFFWKDLTSPLNGFHPTYLSLYINLLIAYVAFSLFPEHAKSTMAKIGMAAILLLLFVTQVLLSSKIQLICTSLIFLLIVMRLSRAVNPRIIIVLLVALAAVLFITLRSSYTWERFTHINTLHYTLDAPPETFNEFTIRLGIIECAVPIIREHPLLGTGAGDVNDDLDIVYRKNEFKFGYLDKLNPHNEYLGQLLGLGVVGLSVLILGLGVSLVAALKRKDAVYIIFLIIIILSFMFESMLERQKGVFLFALFNSLYLFHYWGKKEHDDAQHHG